jgi:glycosyltransferase involved in cell wall biosynthesis
MPLRRYGIYLDWGLLVDLRAQGLGRQLAGFLKGAAERPDVRFVIACPSWGRAQLRKLCEIEQVPQDHFELLSPELPLSLRIYQALLAWRDRPRRARPRWRPLRALWVAMKRMEFGIERRLVSTRSPLVMVGLLIAFAPVLILLASIVIILALRRALYPVVRRVSGMARQAGRRIVAPTPLQSRGLLGLRFTPKQVLRRLYGHLEGSETDLLIAMIDRRPDIAAWYCPTAFWPQFNRIRAPGLMCVPDAVVTDFPVGFELADGPTMFAKVRQLQLAIRGAAHWVTYSEHVKWRTVVGDYDAEPARVHVVPHAAQELLMPIRVSGTADDDVAIDAFCRQLLLPALRTASASAYTADFRNDQVEFIFYASQFRPNKNVITLLRAFDYLLRERYTSLKLVLTGWWEDKEVSRFIAERRLSHDVLLVHNLSLQELAAFYRLARLAVNPSLSEGGFPFTFTEALSVGTPVVMSRIAVTEDIVTDPDLQATMLFDPFDWRKMAERIEWALHNRADLLAQQRPLYERLAQRTWRHVVDDHIDILDRIAVPPQDKAGPQ